MEFIRSWLSLARIYPLKRYVQLTRRLLRLGFKALERLGVGLLRADLHGVFAF